MANWVKFLRGTFDQYSALPTKEEDTLYFVYSEDGKECALYLGGRLVSGNGTIDGATCLDELTDVLVKQAVNKDFLQHNGTQWVNVSFDSIIEQIKEKIETPTSFITAVNDAQFTVDNGTLGLKPVEISQVSGLSNILDNKVEKEEGSRLINAEEIAALQSVINGSFGEFDNYIKAVNPEVFEVTTDTSTLNLIAIPNSLLTPVIGDMTTLPGYAENEEITLVEEINNIYELLSWKAIEEFL